MENINLKKIKDLIGQTISIYSKPSDRSYLSNFSLISVMPNPSIGIMPEIAIVAAARTSFLGESTTIERDKKLFQYLYKHQHVSPSEMSEIVFRLESVDAVYIQELVEDQRWKVNILRLNNGQMLIRIDLNNLVAYFKQSKSDYQSNPIKIFLSQVMEIVYPWTTELLSSTLKLKVENEVSYGDILPTKRYMMDDGLGDRWVEIHENSGTDQALSDIIQEFYPDKNRYTPEENIEFMFLSGDLRPLSLFSVKFALRAPVLVLWQLVRHRSGSFNFQCLDGETLITFNRPDKMKRGHVVATQQKLSELYRKSISPLNNQYPRENMQIRVLNEKTGEFESGKIATIVKTGIKQAFKITTKLGYSIVSSKNHRFLFENGWETLEKATTLTLINGRAVYSQLPKLNVNGAPLKTAFMYSNKDWLKERYIDNKMPIKEIAVEAKCSSHTIRKYLRQFSLTDPQRSIDSRFNNGSIPWNTDKHYSLNFSPLKRTDWANKSKSQWANKGRGNHHWWKGGMSSERAKIGAWTTNNSAYIFNRDNYICALCGGSTLSNDPFHAHHIIPVWADEKLLHAYDLNNLITMHRSCHSKIHRENLELEFAKSIDSGISFDSSIKEKIIIKRSLRPGVIPKLDQIIKIEYLGEREMYDIAIDGDNHNFVADGFVVHNSGRYMAFGEDDLYLPDKWRKQSVSNKQGSSDEELKPGDYSDLLLGLIDSDNLALGSFASESYKIVGENPDGNEPIGYSKLLSEYYSLGHEIYQAMLQQGAAKEQARLFLPAWASLYTAIVKFDLMFFMRFLRLRTASDAQLEIRNYANMIYHAWESSMPITARLSKKYHFSGS